MLLPASFLPGMGIDDISDILPGCPASLPSVRKSGLYCHVLADESVACQEGLVSRCYVLNAAKIKKHILQNKLISTLGYVGHPSEVCFSFY